MLLYHGSMEPNYNIGDIVIVKKCNAEDIKIGDVISFRSGQSVITHRVENIINEENSFKFETKGDNNNSKDLSQVTANQIEGKVVNRIKKVGYISLFLQNKTSIIIIAFIFFAIYLYSSKREEKKRQRRMKKAFYEEEKLKNTIREVKHSAQKENN